MRETRKCQVNLIGIPGFRNIGLFKKKIGIPGCRNSGLIEGFRNIGLSEYWAVGIVGFRTIGFSEYRVNPGNIYIQVYGVISQINILYIVDV